MTITTAELIGENEAAASARISTSTLARFAEAGYFQVVLRGEERCYPKQALATLFGVSFEQPESTQNQPKKGNVISFPHPENLAAKAVTNDLEAKVELASQPSVTEVSVGNPVVGEATNLHPANSEPSVANSSDIEGTALTAESTSFNSILKMHADILDRQEREILDLRSEREWLKKRIEKLEEKAERDQILLLSEAQTVKQLIQIHSQKRSIIRQSLEWLGIIPQELPEHDSIITGKSLGSEISSSADQVK